MMFTSKIILNKNKIEFWSRAVVPSTFQYIILLMQILQTKSFIDMTFASLHIYIQHLVILEFQYSRCKSPVLVTITTRDRKH